MAVCLRMRTVKSRICTALACTCGVRRAGCALAEGAGMASHIFCSVATGPMAFFSFRMPQTIGRYLALIFMDAAVEARVALGLPSAARWR